MTSGLGIVEALARAKGREVDVRLIADKTTPCGRDSGGPLLADAGVPIWIDDQARIAHAKAMVIDEAVVLTGSYNWTSGAAANSEDLNLISSPIVAVAYAAHWDNRFTVSVRFGGERTGAGYRLRKRGNGPKPARLSIPACSPPAPGDASRARELRR